MLTHGFTEIRNHIYSFIAATATAEGRRVLPCFALVQTCQQIRHEYRPICLKADVLIDWKYFPSYLNNVFSSRDKKMKDIDLAPGKITIFTNPYVKLENTVEIDILPIVKFGFLNKDFKSYIQRGEVATLGDDSERHEGVDDLSTEDLRSLLAADVDTIQKLLAHRHPDWVTDVTEGRIQRIMVSQIGTNHYPRARFSLGNGVDKHLPAEFRKIREKNARAEGKTLGSDHEARNPFEIFAAPSDFDDYMERVRLDDIFLGNQYQFFWDHEWVEQDFTSRP